MSQGQHRGPEAPHAAAPDPLYRKRHKSSPVLEACAAIAPHGLQSARQSQRLPWRREGKQGNWAASGIQIPRAPEGENRLSCRSAAAARRRADPQERRPAEPNNYLILAAAQRLVEFR
ncbi:hypothetical protein D3C77_583340 [compost metagenome]